MIRQNLFPSPVAPHLSHDHSDGASHVCPTVVAGNPADPHRINEVQPIITFVLAGKARFTLRSAKTGKRYTYRVTKKEDADPGPLYFVSVLTGSDNEASYTYLGVIRHPSKYLPFGSFERTKKTSPALIDGPFLAFDWFWLYLQKKQVVPTELEFWHEGRCGRCARTLTVPESIASGFGPECIQIIQKDGLAKSGIKTHLSEDPLLAGR